MVLLLVSQHCARAAASPSSVLPLSECVSSPSAPHSASLRVSDRAGALCAPRSGKTQCLVSWFPASLFALSEPDTAGCKLLAAALSSRNDKVCKQGCSETTQSLMCRHLGPYACAWVHMRTCGSVHVPPRACSHEPLLIQDTCETMWRKTRSRDAHFILFLSSIHSPNSYWLSVCHFT